MAQKETLSSLTHGNFAKELSIADGKMPPNAVDFERLVIGTFLIDKKGLDHSIDLLTPEVFYDPRHQVIFSAILKLYEGNHPVDLMTIIQDLKKVDKLSQAGGDHYIIDLTMGVSSSAHIEYHVRVILEKYILRSLINVSANVIDSSYKESTDVFELLDKAEQSFFEITNGTIKKGFDTANSLVKQAIDTIKSLKDKEGLSGVPSGFRDIDKETGGWQNSDLIIIAARPAMGKTAFLLSMARNIAVGHKIPMALFSLEMASVQLITRMIASETKISSEKLRKGTLDDEEWQRLFSNVSELENAPLYIDETPSLSIFDFRAKCRRLVMQHGVRLIMVDYLQLMTAGSSGKGVGNREQEISMISRSLKAIAKELNVPVIALSQLSRSVEARPGKRPQLSDLRESGAIEQDADIVSFIFRPEYYKITVWDNDDEGQETSTENQAELIIAKHRNGATADVRLSFLKHFAKFGDIEAAFDGAGGGYPSNFGSPDPSGFDKIKTTIQPGAAFDLPDSSKLSGSSMNDFDDDDDFPF
ncbi:MULTISPECIES: replicative DNA helicase [Chryseobacterium]|uniref:Replicative DNA helicase n=1 Tax=Chryseobacterium rhizosphaerae TaxID=395937 RepID=A0AAE3Y7R2_9FLAO|nr:MULTISPECIES: replicative DNA helicase [Chryseobacterium]MBL3546836.1 replicative DNA helicase [Chryseobacterium sp. KMC2]MCQ9635349.1 replicative DNA helicase [Chryseobacterium sp. WG23]MDC8102135.1 replicative DNA helicase [Chryseobacterium rhizosphaerae]MDR6526933.1 replicative DNA helicase [Chryseobacterium rhizosphaerae]MDR6544477.1 replicative DNA helicase [Chryseobacterium rhizosphaerae]